MHKVICRTSFLESRRLNTSDEPELEFSGLSRAIKFPSQVEPSWGISISELKPSCNFWPWTCNAVLQTFFFKILSTSFSSQFRPFSSHFHFPVIFWKSSFVQNFQFSPYHYHSLPLSFITLLYPSLPCITLHYPALPCITLHYPALPFKFHNIFINFVRGLLTDSFRYVFLMYSSFSSILCFFLLLSISNPDNHSFYWQKSVFTTKNLWK